MFTSYYRKSLLLALYGAPTVLDVLLSSLHAGEAAWDTHPDPDRFSIREITAHLADWDSIWLDRIKLTASVSKPAIEPRDEEALAIENDYAHSDPSANCSFFHERRLALIQYLQSLKEEDWERIGRRPDFGDVSIQDQASYILTHDSYHLEQVSLWVTACKSF